MVLRPEAGQVVHGVDVDLARIARFWDRHVGVLAIDDGHHPAVFAAFADQVDRDIGECDGHHLVE